MSIKYKTPSHFSEFSCLGGDCEDTCCRNWDVKLDRKHFDLLDSVMSKDENEKSMFEQYIRVNANSITSDYDYAHIKMSVGGYCAMLDEHNLCSIHVNYGVKVLGNVCTMFPRVISRCENTVELSGALSCPEVVRHCIDDATPLKLKRFKISDLPRGKNYPIQRELSTIEDDYYSESFVSVRDVFLSIMSKEDSTLEYRLYLLANTAHKLSSFYYRGCTKPEKEQFDAVFNLLSDTNISRKLTSFISDYDTGPISMVVIHSVLSIKIQQAENENISMLYADIISRYNAENNSAEKLSLEISNIVNKLDDESKSYIDKSITRYILNCLYREWFISMPDPFTYLQMLLIRVSILRSLIYLDIGQKDNLNIHRLKERIVYVMYNFARNIDQNLEFLKLVYDALSEESMMTFDFSPAFIRIY